jgi:hypothetical protein
LVFEIDEPGAHKDEEQYQRDHDIVMKAATVMGPEEIALEYLSYARHACSIMQELRKSCLLAI